MRRFCGYCGGAGSIAAWVLGALLVSRAAQGVVTLELVAQGNFPAPGTGANFGTIHDTIPTIDNQGNVSFLGTYGSNVTGVWSGPPGALSLVAGGSTSPYSKDVEEGGPLYYRGPLVNAGVTVGAGWQVLPIGQQLVIFGGMTAPGTGGATFGGSASSFTDNASAQYAFFANLTVGGSVTSSNNFGIWSNVGSGLQLAARQGATVPGFGTATFSGGFGYPSITGNGTTVFFDSLSTGATGIFSVSGGTLTTIAHNGSAGVGTVANQQPQVDTGGDVAFYDSNSVIWLKNSTGLHNVAHIGSSIAGGGTLTSTFAESGVSDDGRVFFTGAVSGETGLFSATVTSASVTEIAGPGKAVPGLAGWTFVSIGSSQINRLGQVLFLANVEDAGNNQHPGFLFATDLNGGIELVSGLGSQIQVGAGMETIAVDTLSPFQNGGQTQISDNGQVVFYATTTGADSLIAVATISVPEPASLALLTACAAGLLMRRRGRRTR